MKKIFPIFLIFIILSCAKNFDKSNIMEVSPPPTAKIDGKHAIFISNENFKQVNQIKSENCESWALKLNFDEPIKKSIENLVNKIDQGSLPFAKGIVISSQTRKSIKSVRNIKRVKNG